MSRPSPLPGRAVRGSRSGRPVMALLDLLDLLGRRWTLRLLWELHGEPCRCSTCSTCSAGGGRCGCFGSSTGSRAHFPGVAGALRQRLLQRAGRQAAGTHRGGRGGTHRGRLRLDRRGCRTAGPAPAVGGVGLALAGCSFLSARGRPLRGTRKARRSRRPSPGLRPSNGVPTSSWCFVEAGEVTPAECKHRVLAAGLDAFVENRRSAEERGVPGGACEAGR